MTIKIHHSLKTIFLILIWILWTLNSSAAEVDHQTLKQQADGFLAESTQQQLSVNKLYELEQKGQELIKDLQACEKSAENEIEQLTEIRNIEALNSGGSETDEGEQSSTFQTNATQEVDRQINASTKKLITCRLKSNQMEEARLSILDRKQQLWVGELTSRQAVWAFINQSEINLDTESLNEILPLNSGFFGAVILGLGFYLLVLWRNYSRWFVFDSPDLASVNLFQYFKKLLFLHGFSLVLAVVYYYWADSHGIHALVLALGLLLRDACVLLPMRLLVNHHLKPIVNKFMVASSVLIIVFAVGWSGINFKQNFGLGWFDNYSFIITPLVLVTSVLFGLSSRYFYLLLKPYKDRHLPYWLTNFAAVCFVAFALTYAQGAQYLLVVSVGLMVVHWLMKSINSIRKVALLHRINDLKQQEAYDGSNFSFPFWVSLSTVILSSVVGLVVLSFIAGVSKEAYKQTSFIFNEGFALGSVRIVPKDVLISVVMVALIIYAIKKLKLGIENRWFSKSRVRDSSREVLSMIVWYIGLTVAIFVGLSVAGFDISRLAIIAGALSVGIGFGLQNIVSNFVSGLILLFERPVTRGDWVEVGDTVGLIEKVKIRATRIRTFDNAEILVPNSELLSHHVTNWTLSNSIGRITVKVGVAYGSDVEQVREILNEIAANHAQVMQRDPYKHKVLFREFGDSSLNFELRVMIKNIKLFLDVESDLNFAIDQALREAEISIPFPQRDLHLIDSSVLTVDAKKSSATDEEEHSEQGSESDGKVKKSDQSNFEKTGENKLTSPSSTPSDQSNDVTQESDKDEVEMMIEEDEKRQEAEAQAEQEAAKKTSQGKASQDKASQDKAKD